MVTPRLPEVVETSTEIMFGPNKLLVVPRESSWCPELLEAAEDLLNETREYLTILRDVVLKAEENHLAYAQNKLVAHQHVEHRLEREIAKMKAHLGVNECTSDEK